MKSTSAMTAGAVLALSICGAAQAQRLDTFAGSLELPFAFHVQTRTDKAGNSVAGFTASQRWRLAVDTGPLQGQPVDLEVRYALPADASSAKALRAALDLPGAAPAKPVAVGQFAFALRTRNTNAMSVAVLAGAMNNAMLSVRMESASATQAVDTGAAALRSFALDFAGVLRARAHFDAAAAAAIAGRRMRAPSGEYEFAGLIPRLYGVSTQTAGDGRVLATRNAYAFARAGFWGEQFLEFASACGVEGGQTALARLSHYEPDSPVARVVSQSAAVPEHLGGLAASSYEVKLASTLTVSGRNSAGSRWIANDGANWYAFDILASVDPTAFARAARAQIEAKPLACATVALLKLDGGAPAAADGAL